MSAPLDKGQKAYLAQLAREAFARAQRAAREAGAVFEGDLFMNALLNDFEEWRHEEVSRACSKNGLRCCTQDDYGAVKGHFLAKLGREGQAVKAIVRGEGNEGRVARFKLRKELEGAGFKWGYAEAICKSKFKCDLASASPAQVWKIFYDVKRNAKARREKASQQ